MPGTTGEGDPLVFRVEAGRPGRADLVVHFPDPPARWRDNPYAPCANILFFSRADEVAAWCGRHGRPLGAVVEVATVSELAGLWFADYASPDWRPKPAAEAGGDLPPARPRSGLLGRAGDVPVAAVGRERAAGSVDSWSVQENAGHRLDLEPLWLRRVEDLAVGRPELAEADLTNRRTHQADPPGGPQHGPAGRARRRLPSSPGRDGAPGGEVLGGGAAVAALHPRLRVAMNVVDVAYFVAEHDDYHPARITELLREGESSPA